MNRLVLFGLLLKASLFSTGGTGNLPSLHDDLLPRHWAAETDFAEALVVGQLSPGPNGLWVVSLGYLVNGLPGALISLIAITIPPFLVILVERFYHRTKDHPAMDGFVRGMSLAVVGISIFVLLQILSGIGLNPRTLVITLASFGIALTRRVPVFALLALAAVCGLLWH